MVFIVGEPHLFSEGSSAPFEGFIQSGPPPFEGFIQSVRASAGAGLAHSEGPGRAQAAELSFDSMRSKWSLMPMGVHLRKHAGPIMRKRQGRPCLY